VNPHEIHVVVDTTSSAITLLFRFGWACLFRLHEVTAALLPLIDVVALEKLRKFGKSADLPCMTNSLI
jgi:hypothetical protein